MNWIKIANRFTVILAMFFLFQNLSSETLIFDSIEENKENIDGIHIEKLENFDEFFLCFSTDTIFQLSRIVFPISYHSIDIEDNKKEYTYTEQDFWYLDFSMDVNASDQIIDAYKPQIIKEGNSKIIYIKKGIDNGIMIEYHFEANDFGKWQLIKIVDKSN